MGMTDIERSESKWFDRLWKTISKGTVTASEIHVLTTRDMNVA